MRRGGIWQLKEEKARFGKNPKARKGQGSSQDRTNTIRIGEEAGNGRASFSQGGAERKREMTQKGR